MFSDNPFGNVKFCKGVLLIGKFSEFKSAFSENRRKMALTQFEIAVELDHRFGRLFPILIFVFLQLNDSALEMQSFESGLKVLLN